MTEKVGSDRQTTVGAMNPCPNCGSRNVVEFIYGLADGDFGRDPEIEAGELKLAGCVIEIDSTRFQCDACQYAFGDVV